MNDDHNRLDIPPSTASGLSRLSAFSQARFVSYRVLLLVALLIVIGMFLYELGKETFFPWFTKWESHLITIGVSACMGTLGAYLALRVIGQAQNRYRLLAENAHDIVYHIQLVPELRFDYLSPSVTRITGYAPEEYYADPQFSLKFVYPDDWPVLESITQQGTPNPLVLRWVHKDGTIIWIELQNTIILDETGQMIAVEGIARDVTERKQAEDTLRKNQSILNETQHLTKVGGWEYEVETGRFFWTAELYNLHEVPPDFDPDDIDRNIGFYSAEDQPIVERAFWQAVNKGTPYDLELRFTTAKGRQIWVRTIGHVERQGDKVVRVFGNFMDITQRKLMEQQHLQLSLEKERVKILANFITQASHEFRTPLATINTSAYLLKKVDDPLIQTRHIGKIEDQVAILSTLIDALTTIVRLDSIQELPTEEVNLCQILTVLDNGKQPVIQKKNIHSMLELPSQPVLIQADAAYLQRAIEAIVDNAIRFMSEGGTLSIKAIRDEDNVYIIVADTGIGIRAEDLPHIFESFYRVDKVGTTRGFGLGLSIARAIIELHHGHIEVESTVDEGSTFRVVLPLI